MKIKRFFNNMKFMFKNSWMIARSMYFFIAIRMIINTVQPFVMLIIPKYIIDELSGECRTDIVVKYIILYAFALIFFNLLSLLISHYSQVDNIRLQHKISVFNLEKWLYMDYDNFENGDVRDLYETCVGNVNPCSFVEGTLLGFFTNLFQLAGYTYIIASLHPIIIFFILAIIASNSIITHKSNKLGFEYEPLMTKISRRCRYIFETMIDFDKGKEVRVNGVSEWLKQKYVQEENAQIKLSTDLQKKHSRMRILALVIDLIQTIVIYGYCSYLSIIGGVSVGSFTVFLGAVTAFSGSFTGFISRFSDMAILSDNVDKYRTFLEYTEHKGADKEVLAGENPTKGIFDIEFVGVSFKYPNTERFVLKNINMKINAGERLSLVGYNGAGKSTLIKLICRLYEPTDGKIFIGGVDISTINLADYRNLLSVVFQDYDPMRLSIKDNIVMNNEYDKKRMEIAVEQSGLTERIALLEHGTDTQLCRQFDGEGITFSGGEAQKLSCARAYYKDAPVVIFDEPTASLDAIAEARLYERFNSIVGKKTSIYISHRLASATFADTVAVLVDGEIVEQGTHKDLLRKNGVYADMFKKQAHYYVMDNEADGGEQID